jgi:hypothetical protein
VVAAALTGVAAFAAAYILAILSLIVTTLLSAGGSTASAPSGSSLSGGGASLADAVSLWSIIAGAPAQLVLLADLGRLRIAGSVEFLTTISGSAHVGFVPALVAAAQIVALVLGVRLFRRRDLGRREVLLTSAISGVALALITLIMGLVLGIRLPREDGLDIRTVTAVTALAIVVALVVGFAATAAARPVLVASLHPLVSAALGAVRVAALHLGVVTVVAGITVIVYGVVTTPTGGAGYPLVIGNIAVIVASLGFLGGLSVSDSASSLAGTATGSSAGSGTASVFAHTSGWLWLMVLLVVVTALAAGFALALRRGSAARTTLDWAFAVAAYALGGVVVLLLGTAVFSVQVSGLGGSGSIGVTPWTVAVLAGWGAAVEAVARYAAPRILPSVAPAATAFARRVVGHDRLVEPAAGADPRLSPYSPESAAAGLGAAEAAAPAPLSPRARRILVRSLIGGGIVVILVIAGVVTAGALRTGPFGPATAAKSYLTDLARGDASAARALSGQASTSNAMMSDGVFSKATGRISEISIGAVSTAGDVATVAYRYTQSGSRHDGALKLDRTGTSLLVEDHWRPTPVTGTATVEVSEALGDADVTSNGQKIGTVSNGELKLTAFPGTYTIAVAGSDYFSGGTKNVTITPDSLLGEDVRFEAKPTDALTADATKMITDLIASCEKTTSGDLPDDCPFYGVSGESDVTYRVTKQPTLSVDVDDSGDISVTSDRGEGSVSISYTDSFFGESYPEHYDEDFSVYEYLAVKDGKLVFRND